MKASLVEAAQKIKSGLCCIAFAGAGAYLLTHGETFGGGWCLVAAVISWL